MLVDRYDRKWLMMLSDLASGLVTVLIFGLFAAGRLEIWHLFFTSAVQGAFQAFQWPAYSAAIASMLPKDQYTRANSLMELAGPSSQIFAPLLAGALLGLIGLRGIMIVDIVTFSAALAALLAIRVPAPVPSVEGRASRGGFWAEISFGFRYIFQRPSLLGVQGLFLVANFVGRGRLSPPDSWGGGGWGRRFSGDGAGRFGAAGAGLGWPADLDRGHVRRLARHPADQRLQPGYLAG
jgi:MFS family permease